MSTYVKLQLIAPTEIKDGVTLEKVLRMPVIKNFKPKKASLNVKQGLNKKYFIVEVFLYE